MPKSMEETTVKSAAPTTPMRRLWCKFQVLRPSRPLSLGKRHRAAFQPDERRNSACLDVARDISASSLNATSVSESSSEESLAAEVDDEGGSGLDALQLATPVTKQAGAEFAERARVAIQQSDSPFDAIVVTTLPCYPFHCHDDLIKMSRSELIATANLFNAHLPGVLQIDVSESLSDTHIRRAIETLVGIIPTTPGAPKAARKLHSNDDRLHKTSNVSPPSSPLAMHASRRRGPACTVGMPLSHLERLDEVDESDFFTNQRPLKRRKVSDVLATPTFFERQPMMVDTPVSGMTHSYQGTVSMCKSTESATERSPDL